MAQSGGQPGNQNAAKGRRWSDAIDRALAKRSKAAGIQELDRLAEQFLDTVEAMTNGTDKRAPSIAGFSELADRLDGKAPQSITGDGGGPVIVEVVRFVAENSDPR